MSSDRDKNLPLLSAGEEASTEAPVEPEMTLTEHLIELRKRVIYAVLSVSAGFALSFSYSEQIFEILRGPILPFLAKSGSSLNYTGLTEKFMAHVKVSILSGFILTTPIWLYQVWAFVAPGLYKK
ncbi:MAG: twin-arginine translocase subunit TatC, partial [Bdellovibrionales bacterium]|nr:twin-arginine translocase subunit TatC [Bdellovibrionales bacterium]